jgi:hypothetical protein
MTTDLDSRARSAAAGLRRAAFELDAPPVPQLRPTASRPGHRLAVAAAVGLLVAAATAAAVIIRSGGGESPPTAAVSGAVPVLVAESLPEGLAPTGAVELPLAGEERGPEHLTVMLYGDANAPDPTASADLGISVLRSDQVFPAGVGRELTVRGLPGWVSTDGAGRVALTWQEVPGVLGLVTSGTLDEADLVAVAEGLEFSSDHAQVDPTLVPAGLTLLGSMTDAGLTGALAPAVLPDTVSGHVVAYHNDAGGVLLVTTVRADAGEAAVLRWMAGRALGTVEVRGLSGWLATQENGTADGATLRTVVWEESPGIFVVVSGSLDEDALLPVAEGLRPASAQEWADLDALGHDLSGGR